MPGAGFNHRGKMISFVTPHRAHYGNIINHAAHIGKPIRNGNARFAVAGEGAQARDDRPSHFRQVVTEANRVNELARVFVILGIEGINVADTPTHKKKDDRLRFRLKVRPENCILDFTCLGPKSAQGDTQKTAACPKQKVPTRNPPARKDSFVTGHK